MQKVWKELYNQETAVGGTLAAELDIRQWDAVVAAIETLTAAGDSFGLNAVFDDGTTASLSAGPTAVGIFYRTSIGRGVETDAIAGAIESWPIVSKMRWNVDAGAGGTMKLRLWGVKIG